MSKFLLICLCVFMGVIAFIEFIIHILLQNVGTFVFGFVAIICMVSILTDRELRR